MANDNFVVHSDLIPMSIDQVLIDIISLIVHKIYGKLVSRTKRTNRFLSFYSLLECQFCGKRYSRKDSLKHHIKTQHTQFIWLWNEKNTLSDEKEQMDNDDVVLVT
jgi:hypothetical protein